MSTVTFLILEAIGYPTPQAADWPAMFTLPPPPHSPDWSSACLLSQRSSLIRGSRANRECLDRTELVREHLSVEPGEGHRLSN